MADDIRQLQIGDPASLVAGSITVNNTQRSVDATLTLLSNGVQVPVTISSATVDASGNVIVTGTTALGATVNVNLNETAATANVQVNALGIPISATVSVSAVCFCTGTLIKVPGGETAVEELAIGDIVVTASGAERPVRWIGRRDYAGRFVNANPDLLPVCIKADAIEAGVPRRDLWVSPKHALFLDGVLIPAEALLNGRTVVKASKVETLTYWHVELDSHDVLVAENLAAESFVDDAGRGLFHNAETFYARYPDAVAADAVYAAPRVLEGHIVEQVRRRIDARAGLNVSEAKHGTLRGAVIGFDGERLTGWAVDDNHPHGPVCLDILVDGSIVARAYADQRQPGLAGQDASHGFDVRLGSVSPIRTIEVRRSADGAALAGSIGAALDMASAA